MLRERRFWPPVVLTPREANPEVPADASSRSACALFDLKLTRRVDIFGTASSALT